MKQESTKDNRYWKKRIEAKEFYSGIKKVVCPAFSGEEIVFNTHGFTHLIRKSGVLRPEGDQIRRFSLLKHVISILTDENICPLYSQEESAEFWTFSKVCHGRMVKVVVRRLPNGARHFFSVMNKG